MVIPGCNSVNGFDRTPTRVMRGAGVVRCEWLRRLGGFRPRSVNSKGSGGTARSQIRRSSFCKIHRFLKTEIRKPEPSETLANAAPLPRATPMAAVRPKARTLRFASGFSVSDHKPRIGPQNWGYFREMALSVRIQYKPLDQHETRS